MANPIPIDEEYLQVADVVAKRSHGTRAKVGAIIVKDNCIISEGYNGLPSGEDNSQMEILGEDGQLTTNPRVIHAEMNAILKLARHGGVGADGGTLYCAYSACVPCCDAMVQARIKRHVFRNFYRLNDHLKSTAARHRPYDSYTYKKKLDVLRLPHPTPPPEERLKEAFATIAAREATIRLVEAQRDQAEGQRDIYLAELNRGETHD